MYILLTISLLFIIVLILILIQLSKKYKNLSDRFVSIQELSYTGYFESYKNSNELYWSEQLNVIFGLPAGTQIDSTNASYELIHPEDREDYISTLKQSLSAKKSFELDFRIINQKTNQIEYLRTNANVISDNNGNAIGFRGTVRNLTKKKSIERSLESSLNQQKAILSNIDDLVFILDFDGNFCEYYNPANLRLITDPENFLGKNYNEVLPDYLKIKLHNALEQVNSTEDSETFEFFIEEGKEISTYSVRTIMLGKLLQGKNGYLILIRDVSKFRNVESQLQKSEANFKQLTDLLPVAVYEVDTDFNVKYVNKTGMEWFQYDLSDLKEPFSIFNIVAKEDKPKMIRNIKRRINFEEFGPVEYKLKRKNGETFDALIYAAPILLANAIKGVRGVLIDITERKKYLNELEKYSKFNALGILAGGIAHNFKNILAAVTLSVDMIKLKPESLDKQIERISRSLEHANALASRFQTFTKSNEPNYDKSDINQIINEAIEIAFAGTACSVKTFYNANISNTLADSKQLNEVFLNLFINAQQATNDSCLITVTTANKYVEDNEIPNLLKGEYIKITVSDNGTGMTKTQLDNLFTPFFTTKPNGNGLGLATVFSIITSHNGVVTVDSEVGVGTQFHVYLPILDNRTSDIKSIKNDFTLNSEYKIRVLLIDDDKNITEMMTEISKAVDRIELKAFNNPHEAIQYFKLKNATNPYEVVILDMTLVGYDLNGVDILNKLRSIDPAIKSIIFTGHSSKPLVAHYKDYGFDAQLDKPCSFEQLVNKVNDVFVGRK